MSKNKVRRFKSLKKTNTTNSKMVVTGDTKIWFGQYRGQTFDKVPATYFLNYLDGKCEKRIQDYIDENRDVLEAQAEGRGGVD